MLLRRDTVIIVCLAILFNSLHCDAGKRRDKKKFKYRFTKRPPVRPTPPPVRPTPPPVRPTPPPVRPTYKPPPRPTPPPNYEDPIPKRINYREKYPQYWYKRYSEDCNQGYYDNYLDYLGTFDDYWYRRRYDRYEMTTQQKKEWSRYGRYEGPLLDDIRRSKPEHKECCYTFDNQILTIRPGPPKPAQPRIRQEYRTLSNAQRNQFHTALNNMKNSASGIYFAFVGNHRDNISPHAHGGASFLPWHREFLFRFEQALAFYGFPHGLPYFDTTSDEQLPDPSASAMWTDDYMGNLQGNVISGPAGGWTTIPDCHFMGTHLRREGIQGWQGKCNLFSDFDVDYVYSKKCFKDITCNTDCKFEMDHAGVHNFVGGHMGNPTCAPSDPIFFMHHAFVDCIWEEFRRNHQTSPIYREYPSQVNGDDVGTHINPNGFEWWYPMSPIAFIGILNGHGIQAFYESYYRCAGRPFRCDSHNDCDSDALWCNKGRCAAKVREDGNCSNLPNAACYCPSGTPVCVSNKCTCQ